MDNIYWSSLQCNILKKVIYFLKYRIHLSKTYCPETPKEVEHGKHIRIDIRPLVRIVSAINLTRTRTFGTLGAYIIKYLREQKAINCVLNVKFGFFMIYEL